MTMLQAIPLSDVATHLDAFFASAAKARDNAADLTARQRLATLADRYETLAYSVKVALATEPRKAVRKAIASRMDAATFWTLHAKACTAINAVYGDQWRVKAPFGETTLISAPAPLRKMKTERGTVITWRRDWRMPAAQFWPGGSMPTELEICADYPRSTAPAGSKPDAIRRLSNARNWFRSAWLERSKERAPGEAGNPVGVRYWENEMRLALARTQEARAMLADWDAYRAPQRSADDGKWQREIEARLDAAWAEAKGRGPDFRYKQESNDVAPRTNADS